MAEVGYLLGAGASAGCIPVVNQMGDPKRKKDLWDKFTSAWGGTRQIDMFNNSGSISSNQLRAECLKTINRIERICNQHSSIDTFAKKLFISNQDKEYRKLKIDLSFYFTLIQILNLPDKRYDNFWASILNDRNLPNKISILSWNYDFQFEKTYKEFAGLTNLTDVWKGLNICSPSFLMNEDQKDKFHFTKLNGSARFRDNGRDSGYYYCEFNDDNVQTNLDNLFKTYYLIRNASNSELLNDLTFAWEVNFRDLLLKSIEPILAKLEVLVIIGYSFPFFNRKIDSQLFARMKSLEKVIIQDCNPESIKERLLEFLPSRSFRIELRNDVEQFVYPIELEV